MGFGDNEYVMTEKQVKAFDRLIEEIAINQLNQLVDKFNSLQEHAFKFVELSSSIAGLDQLVEKGARVSEHKEQFEKLLKGLANGGQTRQTSYQDSGKSQEEIEYERRLRDYQNLFNG